MYPPIVFSTYILRNNNPILLSCTLASSPIFFFIFILTYPQSLSKVETSYIHNSGARLEDNIYTPYLRTYSLLFILVSLSLSPLLPFSLTPIPIPSLPFSSTNNLILFFLSLHTEYISPQKKQNRIESNSYKIKSDTSKK